MDLVVNHSSSQHPWFLASKDPASPYRDYYGWREDDPGWLGLGGPAWHKSGGDYYLGLFWSEMPDLNYRNPEVVKEMDDIARFWLELGVDGFRIDAVQHVVESTDGLIRNTPENLEWTKNFEAFIKSVNPDAFLVGETWTDTETIADYFTKANLDLAFDYPLYTSLLDAVGKSSATNLNFTLESEARLFPPDARAGHLPFQPRPNPPRDLAEPPAPRRGEAQARGGPPPDAARHALSLLRRGNRPA